MHDVDSENDDDNKDDDDGRRKMVPRDNKSILSCWETSKKKNRYWTVTHNTNGFSISEAMQSKEFDTPELTTHLPTRTNSPTRRCRLMAISIPRTVMPSQKQATTLALGRWPRSFCNSLSKLCSPALLYILSEWAIQIPSFAAMSLNASIPLSP